MKRFGNFAESARSDKEMLKEKENILCYICGVETAIIYSHCESDFYWDGRTIPKYVS